MSDGMPYIGSHITLITKSDIRYEGTLYTINMDESSIALSNGAARLQQRTPICACYVF